MEPRSGSDLQNWNPMEEDFCNRRVNAYREGVGQDLQNRDISDVGRVSDSKHKPVVLYVTNIPLDMDEIALQNLFEAEGKVVQVHLPVPSPEKVAQFHSKIGFVTMDNARGAQEAIENLNGFWIKDKCLSVKVKLSKEEIQRKKDHREKEEEFFRSLKPSVDKVADDASADATDTGKGSGSAESQGVPKTSGSYGKALSVSSDLSVTLQNDGRKVQDHRMKAGLLPSPDVSGGAAFPAMKGMIGARPSPVSAHHGRHVAAASGAGSSVGTDRCASCHRQAALRCQACRRVYYCNGNCQRAHWPTHRTVCTYDSKPATAPARSVSVPEPDLKNLDVDVSESFITDNQEYLKEWLSMATSARSDSSSSSGDRQMKNSPQFFGKKTSSVVTQPTARPRPEPDGGRNQASNQRNGQAQFEAVATPRHNHQPQSNPAQQRRAGPQGMEGKNEGRPQRSENQGPYQKEEDRKLGQYPQQRGKFKFDEMRTERRPGPGQDQGRRGGPGPQDQQSPPAFQQQRDGPGPRSDGPGPRNDGSGPRGYGPGPHSDGYAQNDRSDQPRRDGPGFQQGRKGPDQNMQGERANQFQRQNGPQQEEGVSKFQHQSGLQQGERANQFKYKNGPRQGERVTQFQRQNGPQEGEGTNQFQRRSGPQEGERVNQFQRRNGPQGGERANQFQRQNGPQEENRANQFQPRSGPQQGRGGARGPGDRGDQSQRPKRDSFGSHQRREGPNQGGLLQDPPGPEPRNPDSARGPPQNRQNQNWQGQFPQQGNGDRRGGPNNRGPRNQKQERGYNNNNNRGKKERRGRPSGHYPSAGSSVDADTDSWEEKTPKSPPPKPTPSAAQSSPVAMKSEMAPIVAESESLVPLSSETQAYKPYVLELKTPVTVIVSHLENPQCFWVHIAEQVKVLAPVLQEAVSEYKATPATAAQVGQLFLCEYMGELARARVVSVTGSKVRIFYIDYGNSEDTEVSQLLPVPAQMASLPAMGIPCTLQVSPRGGGEWPAEVITLMKNLFNNSELCTLIVLVKQPSISEVKLVRFTDGLDATEFLKEKGYGITPAAPAAVEAPVVASVVASPPVATLSSSRIMVADMSKVIDQLSVGDVVDVLLLESLKPMKFFVRSQRLEKDFTDFSLSMLADYNNDPPIPYMPVVGEMVVGRFSVDNSWYRAEVLEVLPNSREACLFYVDFGNEEQLPFEQLRALKPAHAATPIQGFWCSVGGVKAPAEGEWQKEQLAAYISCLGKYLKTAEGVPFCTVIVECIKDGVVWVDVVHEEFQQSLAEELAQLLDGASLPQPIQPQELSPSGNVPEAQTPVITPTPAIPDVEQPTPSQLDLAASTHPARLTRLTLSVGQQLTAGIQEVESCHRFYITDTAAEKDFNLLAEKLNMFCLESGQSQACEKVSAGDVVLAQFSVDNTWYRGLVENVSDDGTTCTIFFVDFGNKEDKQVASLRVIPPQFLVIPAQAIACRLEGVPQSTSQQLETVFIGTFLQTEAVIKVVGVEEDCCSVEVFTMDKKSALGILGLLESQASTPPIHPSLEVDAKVLQIPTSPCPPLEDASSASAQQEASALASFSPTLQQGASAIVSLSHAVEQGTAVEQGASAIPYPSLAEHQDSGDDALPPLTRADLPFGLTKMDKMDNMVVTHVDSPSCLYAVNGTFTLAQHDEGGLVSQLKDLNSTAPPLDHLPNVGRLLSGCFEGEWFRCEVIEIVSSQVRVSFFDYGNEELLDLSELRPLPKELCDSYPLATIKCCIHGIRPVSGETWDEETCALIKQNLENEWVTLQCVSVSDDTHHVMMTKDSDQQDVGQMLVDSGKAVLDSDAQNSATAQKDTAREDLERQMRELQAKLAAMDSKH